MKTVRLARLNTKCNLSESETKKISKIDQKDVEMRTMLKGVQDRTPDRKRELWT